MGIEAESIIVRSASFDEVRSAFRRVMTDRGYEEETLAPIRTISAPPDFEKRKRRQFFLALFESGFVELVEKGSLAERELARLLSRWLSSEVIWLALHESYNAWGLMSFIEGEETRRELHPEKLFLGERPEDEYEDDATERMYEESSRIGTFDPFLTYHWLANQSSVVSVETLCHLAFIKASAKEV